MSIQKAILKIVLINNVRYEKSNRFTINCENPTNADEDNPKKMHICKQENSLKVFT